MNARRAAMSAAGARRKIAGARARHRPVPARASASAQVPGPAQAPSPAQAHSAPLTFGVEEEFLLLDAATGALAPAGHDVLALLEGEPGYTHELMLYQVEAVTGVCSTLEEARRQLLARRELAAEAAALLGCRLVASGIAPSPPPAAHPVTPDPRYGELARMFPALMARGATCGCHVHVGVPSRALGVQVLARLRPWLATLLAVSANSPIADGRESSWASRRYVRWCGWPSAVPPMRWRDPGAYDAEVRRIIERGGALDERGVYFHARLSPRYPTVEVRIADAGLTVDDTILITALVRALVATALEDARRGAPARPSRRPGCGPP
ncbi:carboxylate-amine ligase [Thermocatellispora tengchongensis]|uniref:carboxylate-amine ligase n=1 Tax=Thermocatellispora tengchongensis TaxID=1073253 RepID=UPI00363D6E1C